MDLKTIAGRDHLPNVVQESQRHFGLDGARLTAVRVKTAPDFGAKGGIRGVIHTDASFDGSGPDLERVRRVRLSVWDGDLSERPLWYQVLSLEPENRRIALHNILLQDIRLWHLDHPALYTLRLELLAELVIDEVTLRVGFRKDRAVDSQLYLNHDSLPLAGVEHSQDVVQ